MGVVCPIKDIQILERMKEHLRDRNVRDYLMFRVGLNFGLSVQELLDLQVEEVLEQEYFKSNKYSVRICESLQREIRNYIGERQTGYLFVSSRGKQVSRFQLYSILKSVAKATDFKGSVGAITLRKTFAYWAYRNQLVHLSILSKYLNHHTIQHTLHYIDVSDEASYEPILAAMDL